MSKQEYELLQWYPGIRTNIKEGTIFEEYNEKSYISKGYDVPYIVPRWEIENNPEFWKKVEEKNYEILQVKASPSHPYYSVSTFNSHLFDYNNTNKNLDVWGIHSVKRLSDGEIFTIGDRVENQFGIYSITKFKQGNLGKGKLIVRTDGNNAYLSETEHHEEPLFTTEDGFDIHEKDKYWGVTSGLYLKPSIATDPPQEYKAKFAIKEKAEKYIEEHRVRYSRSDLREAYENAKLLDSKGSFTGTIHAPTFRNELDPEL